jgi:prolipoprotein diacylglyceryltransferase
MDKRGLTRKEIMQVVLWILFIVIAGGMIYYVVQRVTS